MPSGLEKLRELDDTVIRVTSPDRAVTVEYGVGTCDIRIAPGAFGRHTEQSLSNVITATVQAAGTALSQEYQRLRRELRGRG